MNTTAKKLNKNSMLTTREAAPLLGVHYSTVVTFIHRGTLRATRRGRDWFITLREIERYNLHRVRPGNPNFGHNKGQKIPPEGRRVAGLPPVSRVSRVAKKSS